MQLELFDIRTDDAALKGKAGQVSGNTGRVAADGKTRNTSGNEDDFLSSLRMVSEERQTKSGDMPTSASGPEPATDGEYLNPLGDILDEIMRDWPSGKRPPGRRVADEEFSGVKTPVAGTAEPGRGLALTAPGKSRQGITRAWPATAGFTTALIKRPSGMPASTQTQPGTRLVPPGVGKAVGLESTVLPQTARTSGNPGKGHGISILSMAAIQSARAESVPVKGAAARRAQKDDAAIGKSATRQPVVDLKSGPHTGSLKAAGENAAWKAESQTAADRQSSKARPTINEKWFAGERPTGKETTVKGVPGDSKLSGDRNHANNVKLAARSSNPAAAATPIHKGSAESGALFKPEVDHTTLEQPRMTAKNMAANEPAVERTPDSKPAGSEQAVRFTPAPEGATRIVKAAGIKRKSLEMQKTSDRREVGEGLRQLTGRDSAKSPAAIERKGALKSDTNLVDQEKFGSDSTIGPAARDQKGGEQFRFEAADARVKPAETVAPVPKSPSGATAAAAPELDKPMLDRVAQARVLEQITAKIRLQPKKGGNEIRIHLKPETLGQVQLKVMAQDQNVTVKMVAETAMARDIIENNIGQLRADLNALGLNVEKLDVDVFTANDPGERNPAEQQGRQARNGQDAAAHGSRDGDLSDRAQQMHAVKDEADGGTLVGVFA